MPEKKEIKELYNLIEISILLIQIYFLIRYTNRKENNDITDFLHFLDKRFVSCLQVPYELYTYMTLRNFRISVAIMGCTFPSKNLCSTT